jgi:simple sugar transport system ATP-binding protein
VLIVAQPTWGVDVGAAAQIHNEILALKATGCAILVVSEELDELFAICDRLRRRQGPPVAVDSGGIGHARASGPMDERAMGRRASQPA